MRTPHEEQLDRFLRFARQKLGDSIRVIVELGARDCRESCAFSEALPAAEVFAFECNPDTLPQCRRNVAGYPRVHLVEKAVADRSGTVSFHKIDPSRTTTTWTDGNPGASSLFRASGKYPVEDYAQIEVRVEAVTLKDFVREMQLPTIDLLWMDIQGAELMALKGLGSELAKVKIIHTEVEFIEIYQGQPLYSEVRQYLTSWGFRLHTFTALGRYSADAVFVNKGCIEGRGFPAWLIVQYFRAKLLVRRGLHGAQGVLAWLGIANRGTAE